MAAEHLDQSMNRICVASARLEAARQEPSLENVREWLAAVAEFTSALSSRSNNESAGEKR
jgi:hypothetical protein